MTTASAHRLVNLHSHPHYRSHGLLPPPAEAPRLAITICSQTGSGALRIAQGLAAQLQFQTPAAAPPWKVLARGLMEKVLEEHHLPTRMAKFLPEDTNNTVDDALDELFGLRPSSQVVVQQTAETILRLAQAGHVILIGWGAQVITRQQPNVFHVRLVASLERRRQRIEQREQLSPKEALDFIARQDRGRQRYLKRYFDEHVAEPLLYHLTINTDLFSEEEATRLIASSALSATRQA